MLVEFQNGPAILEKALHFFMMLKIYLAYNPAAQYVALIVDK